MGLWYLDYSSCAFLVLSDSGLSCVAPVIEFLPAAPAQSLEVPVVDSFHSCKTPYPPQAAWLQPPASQQQWRAAGSEEQSEKCGWLKLKERLFITFTVYMKLFNN